MDKILSEDEGEAIVDRFQKISQENLKFGKWTPAMFMQF